MAAAQTSRSRLRLHGPNSLVARAAEREDGSALIEMAVTFPLLFTLLFCFMELCLAFYSRDMISEAAREGTRYAMFHGASCPNSSSPACEATATDVNSYVTGLGWPNLAGGAMTVDTTYPDGNESVGSLVQVRITYVFTIHMAFVPANSLTMTSTSEAYIVH